MENKTILGKAIGKIFNRHLYLIGEKGCIHLGVKYNIKTGKFSFIIKDEDMNVLGSGEADTLGDIVLNISTLIDWEVTQCIEVC